MQTNLEQSIQKGATVLTPTRRLASYLKNQLGEPFSLKQKVWLTPSVICLDDWLHEQWQRGMMEGRHAKWLITEPQSLQCIENCIVEQQGDTKLIQPFVTAKLAYQAWRVLHQWRATQLLYEAPQNIDEASFQKWMQVYRCWLTSNNAIDNAQLLDELLLFLEKPTEPSNIVLYSFEELTPLQEHFFNQLMGLGWEVQSLTGETQPCEKCVRYEFENAESQYYAAAQWAQTQLSNTNCNIVMVTSEVTRQRPLIETIFNEVLTPLQMCNPIYEVNPLFNISAAIPLGNYTIINTALSLIQITLGKNCIKELASLISSPFIQGAQLEKIARTEFITLLKETSYTSVRLSELVTFIEQNASVNIPELLQCLKKAQAVCSLSSTPSTRSILNKFNQVLTAFGWPGQRALSSVEHQTVHRFNLLLNEISQLDSLIHPQCELVVLQMIRKFAADIPFQAENKCAPIQILGPLEAAGQSFHCLWVMDCDSETWPEPVQPNPFIPYREQKERSMPHASPERQTDYAKKVLNRFRHSAKEVVYSHAKYDQEKMRQVSALINDVEIIECPQKSSLQQGMEALFQGGVALEEVSDEKAQPITTFPYQAGTQLLSMQAECPFKAFATIRLDAKKYEFKQAWLQPKDQGIIVHRVLEKFWKKIQTKQNLLNHSQQQIEELLNIFIQQSLEKFISKDTNPVYFNVEQNRLKNIIRMALSEDEKRVDFEVKQIEMRQSVELGNIHFNLRIDRVDCDEAGNIVIIDYKTGQFSIKDLWGERIKAPQLPMYYISMEGYQPQALGVCVLKSEGVAYIGIKNDTVEFEPFLTLSEKQAKSDITHWQDLSHYWQQTLKSVAYEFMQGHAQVKPLEGTKTCSSCDLSTFCRIFEHE